MVGRRMAFGANPARVQGTGSLTIHLAPNLQDPFVAFHINKDLVKKYMNSLLIGELSPEQPSFEPTKNVRACVCYVATLGC